MGICLSWLILHLPLTFRLVDKMRVSPSTAMYYGMDGLEEVTKPFQHKTIE